MMTSIQQRDAIGDFCGWEPSTEIIGCWRNKHTGLTLAAKPDYPGDLNAMHEAFLLLSNNLHATFWQRLFEIVQSEYDAKHWKTTFYRLQPGRKSALVANATAAQRAEAFLKTINKWQP